MKIYRDGKEYALTDSELIEAANEQRVSRWIKTHGYGLSEKEGHRLVTLHEEGTNDDRKFVETLLTNLNFHTACMCLKKRDYLAAHFQFVKD